jgi:Dyp-type peroxidase family
MNTLATASVGSDQTLELSDIQGIVLFGYSKLTAAAYCLLEVSDAEKARRWLGALPVRTAAAGDAKQTRAVNVALTAPGLLALKLPESVLETFPVEFQEGMVTEFRQRVLGDYGESDPKNWKWGTPQTDPVHVLLMLYAASGSELDVLVDEQTAKWTAGGLRLVQKLDSEWLPDMKEHFGFHDGISDVPVKGHRGRSDGVAAGEFLLGYENQYGKYTATPRVPDVPGAATQLRRLDSTHELGEGRDLGRNGSFLVFRQLHQDVHRFWKWLDEQVGENASERVRVASKMVGRWPNGASLVCHPNQEPADAKPDNDFLYVKEDPHGHRCPLGAHIRRTHPRDALGPQKADDLTLANLHRLIRRGRAYGKPLAPEMTPEQFLATGPDHIERGLHFICFNANIERQFEFVQQTWSNSAKFAGLRNDPDPLVGARYGDANQFTIQKDGVRERFVGMPDFVTTRGGGYFFMPGVAALAYLATA